MQYPHCDARILHAPAECRFCDESGLQEVRSAWGIAFTGHDPESDQIQCPAERARGREFVNYWSGNVPSKGKIIGMDWTGVYPVYESDPRIEKTPDGGWVWAQWFRSLVDRIR